MGLGEGEDGGSPETVREGGFVCVCVCVVGRGIFLHLSISHPLILIAALLFLSLLLDLTRNFPYL